MGARKVLRSATHALYIIDVLRGEKVPQGREERLESSIVDCRLQRDLLGMPLGETELGQIELAWVDVSSDSDGETYRVVLQRADGRVPLTSFYSSGCSGKQEMADAINGFLLSPAQPSFESEQSEWWIFLLSALLWASG